MTISFVTALVGAGVLWAQTPPAAPPAPQPAGQATPARDAVEPQGFAYRPEGRRDPFVSLVRRGDEGPPAARAGGLQGLSTAEVSLRGTLRSGGAFVGILQAVDRKSYIVREGDKLADGTIQLISADAMVIVQQVSDPLSLEKGREVRKSLRHMEEAKQ